MSTECPLCGDAKTPRRWHRLTEHQRPIVMAYVNGASVKEIAKRYEMTTSKVDRALKEGLIRMMLPREWWSMRYQNKKRVKNRRAKGLCP